MVFVIDKKKTPMSPTTFVKARLLLDQNKAVVHKVYPFVIRLKKSVECCNKYSIKIDPVQQQLELQLLIMKNAYFLWKLFIEEK